MSRMKHLSILFLAAVLVAACSPKTAPTKTPEAAPVPKVTYAADIAPLLLNKCAPCHYPGQQGKKLPIDTYEAAKQHLNEMIVRVELPQSDPKFMPFKLKKPALTAEEIELLKNWGRGGYKSE